MGEEHATPPTAAERRRFAERIRYTIGGLLVAGAVVLWLLVEFGGDTVQEALGNVLLVIFAAWLLTWPYRKWKAWRRARSTSLRARAASRR